MNSCSDNIQNSKSLWTMIKSKEEEFRTHKLVLCLWKKLRNFSQRTTFSYLTRFWKMPYISTRKSSKFQTWRRVLINATLKSLMISTRKRWFRSSTNSVTSKSLTSKFHSMTFTLSWFQKMLSSLWRYLRISTFKISCWVKLSKHQSLLISMRSKKSS
jgi:hypothetical protein